MLPLVLWWLFAWFPYFYSDCPWPCCGNGWTKIQVKTNLIIRNFVLNTVFMERRTLLSKQYCKFVCRRTETKFGASCLCFLMPNFKYMYHIMICIKDRIQYYKARIWNVEIISLAIFLFIVIKDPYYYMLLEYCIVASSNAHY